MTRRMWKTILNLLYIPFIIGVLLVISDLEAAGLITMALTLGGMIVCSHFLRCPNCGAWPNNRRHRFTKYCDCCGQYLDDDL